MLRGFCRPPTTWTNLDKLGHLGDRVERMNTPTRENRDWLTYEQAAAELGCSVKTVRRKVADGELGAHKRPGYIAHLIPAADVAALNTPRPVGHGA